MTDHEQNDNFLDEQPDHRDSPSHQVDPTIDFDTPSTQSRASAPTHDDNGYIFIPPTPQSSIDNSADRASEQIENIRNILDDLAYETESKLQQAYSSASKVVAEADSSTGPLPSSSSVPAVPSAKPTAQQTADHNKQSTSKACAICPYYMLGNYSSHILFWCCCIASSFKYWYAFAVGSFFIVYPSKLHNLALLLYQLLMFRFEKSFQFPMAY